MAPRTTVGDGTDAGKPDNELKRGLSSRHLQMIAIGGAIGTGLFVASGGTISQAGPGGALVAYALVGLMVFLLMQSLGEMSAKIPVAGSFQTYATRFVSPSFGFAIGWNYWFNWAITVAAELVAAGIIMDFWFPGVPGWIWAGSFLVLLTGVNALSAKAFGESEFWLSLIKVVAVILFLVAGVLMIVGILGDSSPGLSNWQNREDVFHGGWVSIISVFMIAGFSFQGTELVGVAAGEAKNPRKEVPKAIRSVFWRIMIFYIGAIFVIGCLIPFTDPSLLASGEADIAASPFTLVFERAGIAFAAALMNAVILTAILSAGNSGLYASTRMLYAMAHDGKAPKAFGRTNSRGVPINALLATAAVGLFGFLSAIVGQGAAYCLAAERLGPVRVHRVGRNRPLALPVPARLPGAGQQGQRPALQGVVLPHRAAAGLRRADRGDRGPELRGSAGRSRHGGAFLLHRHPDLPGAVAHPPPRHQVARRAAARDGPFRSPGRRGVRRLQGR